MRMYGNAATTRPCPCPSGDGRVQGEPSPFCPRPSLAPDRFILDGSSVGDEAFVKGLQLRFGPMRGAQIVSAEAPYVAPLAPEVLRLERPLGAGSCAKIVLWFAG